MTLLKCKFCKWQTKRWITTKKGKKRNQSGLLINHVMMEHEEKYRKIVETIEEENPEPLESK